jgi:hypothetical protein
VTAMIQPGQWVRPLWVTEDAPMAGWRFLDGIGDTMWRWQKVLLFSDNYSVPIHVANLAMHDEHGHQLWEVSDTEPEEAA